MESVKIAAEIYMNYNFQFNHINYTEKTKTSICTEKKRVEITHSHTPQHFSYYNIAHSNNVARITGFFIKTTYEVLVH